MPNPLAYIVLFGFPLVVLILFRRLPVPAALAWSVVGGYLMIPTRTGIDLPMLPVIDKDLLPALTAGLCCLAFAGAETGRRARRRALDGAMERAGESGPEGAPAEDGPPRRRGAAVARRQSRGGQVITILIVVMLVVPFFTVLTNANPLVYGPRFIQPLRLYDSFSAVLSAAVTLLPFVLARRYLATQEAHVALLRVLVIAGLGYSLLVFFEVVMSPQINQRLYGFFAHEFIQHIRGNGLWRPIVFLNHGLLVGIYYTMALLAALGLWRAARERGTLMRRAGAGARGGNTTRNGAGGTGRWLLAALWLAVTLVASQNFGAAVIALVLGAVLLTFGLRGQMIVAACIAALVLVYPMARGSGLVPVDRVQAAVATINPGRAHSLQTRLDNEDRLLAHARVKPLFGWGAWGRSRVYDPETGADISVTDGAWVIVMGVSGWMGYLAWFGLLTLPTIGLALRARSLGLGAATAALALVQVANLIDLIPNASLTPLLWLIGGALAGRYERVSLASATANATAAEPARRRRTARGPAAQPAPRA